jgi:hypothetical protein
MSNREEVQAALDKLTNTPIYAYCQELREENKRIEYLYNKACSDIIQEHDNNKRLREVIKERLECDRCKRDYITLCPSCDSKFLF